MTGIVEKLRKSLSLALVAATLLAQPQAARAAGDILSQPSGAPVHAAPQVSASPVASLSIAAPLGAPAGLPGLGAVTALPSAAQAAAATPAAAQPAALPAAAQALAAAPQSPRGGPAAAAASVSHDSLLSQAARLASRLQPGDDSKAGAKNDDGSQAARSGGSGRAAFDGDLRVFLTAHGREPVEASLSQLPALLAADPAYARALNEQGLVRLTVAKKAGAIGAEQLPLVERALRERGVTAPVSLETVPLRSRPASAQAPAGPAAPGAPKAATLGRKALSVLTAPFRELDYLARSFAASLTKPTREEVLGGVVSKGPAFGLSVVWWMSVFMPAQLLAFAATPLGERVVHLLHMTLPAAPMASFPVHFALAVGGSLMLEAFHGVWINTWQNFQNILGRQRGVNYQAAFNFLYMQASAAAFRILTWSVIAATVAPWTLAYWRDMGVSSVLGTFFGVLGFFGLNTLYDKGRISRRARSWLQQGRDLFFLLAGTFLFSGSMHVFWALWTAQQVLDITLYIVSRRAAARPTLYVAEPAVADSDGFKSLYPVTPGVKPSPLQQAVGAVLGNPFVKPFIALGKWAWKKARGK
jgi:hypothetical protein